MFKNYINRFMGPNSNNRAKLTIVVLSVLMYLTGNTLYAQNKIALLVGISDYPQYSNTDASWPKIHGANDVLLMKPILQKQGFKVDVFTNNNATYNSIQAGFEKLMKNAQAGDIVYIHFSGHGQAVEDVNGDENDGWDEAFIPYDARRIYQKGIYAGEKHFLDDELNKYLDAIRTKVGANGIVYVVMDACHAGSSYRGEEDADSAFVRGSDIGFSMSGKTYTPKIDKRGNIRVAAKTNMAPVYMLEACRSYEVNIEIKQGNMYYGPLSYYISQELLTSTLSFDTKWIEKVRTNMDKDIRLVRQHMVTESSK